MQQESLSKIQVLVSKTLIPVQVPLRHQLCTGFL